MWIIQYLIFKSIYLILYIAFEYKNKSFFRLLTSYFGYVYKFSDFLCAFEPPLSLPRKYILNNFVNHRMFRMQRSSEEFIRRPFFVPIPQQKIRRSSLTLYVKPFYQLSTNTNNQDPLCLSPIRFINRGGVARDPETLPLSPSVLIPGRGNCFARGKKVRLLYKPFEVEIAAMPRDVSLRCQECGKKRASSRAMRGRLRGLSCSVFPVTIRGSCFSHSLSINRQPGFRLNQFSSFFFALHAGTGSLGKSRRHKKAVSLRDVC